MTTTTGPVFVPTGRPVRSLVVILVIAGVVLLIVWWTGLVSPRIDWDDGRSTYDLKTNAGMSTVTIHNGGPLGTRVVGVGIDEPGVRVLGVTLDGEPFGPFELGPGETAEVTVAFGSGRCRSNPTLVRVDLRTPSGLTRTVVQRGHIQHAPPICSGPR